MNILADSPARTEPVDFLTPRRLLQSSGNAPDLPAEIAAFHELSRVVAENPRRTLRRLLEILLGLCDAGSAGLTLLRYRSTGEPMMRWAAVSGALAAHEGADATSSACPCGMCLDCGATILLSRPERVFASLGETNPPIVEQLLVPLYDAEHKQLGVLWLAHHDSSSHFNAEDAVMAERLAQHLVVALALLEHGRDRQSTLVMTESYANARTQPW